MGGGAGRALVSPHRTKDVSSLTATSTRWVGAQAVTECASSVDPEARVTRLVSRVRGKPVRRWLWRGTSESLKRRLPASFPGERLFVLSPFTPAHKRGSRRLRPPPLCPPPFPASSAPSSRHAWGRGLQPGATLPPGELAVSLVLLVATASSG